MLRECPNCGGRVTDKAVRCVHCGFCYKICPECDELIGAEEACCPSCGYLFALSDPEAKPEEQAAAVRENAETPSEGKPEEVAAVVRESVETPSEGKPEEVAAVVRESVETPSEGKPVELVPKPSPAVYAERGPVNYLKTNRGLIKYLIFSALTLGIYAFYFIHAVSREVNCVCEGDGKKTRGFFLYMLFTALTFGIYSFVWGYSVCNRMDERIRRTGKVSNVTGGSWFMWTVFGTLLFGVGPLVAKYKLIHGLNEINGIYNREGGSRIVPSRSVSAALGTTPKNGSADSKTGQNVFAIVGFVLSLFVGGVIGLVFSILGLRDSKVYNGRGRGLSIAGIVLSSIGIAFTIGLYIAAAFISL